MTQFHDWEWFTGEVPDGMVQTQTQYQTRYAVERLPENISENISWPNVIAFRRVKEPARGVRVFYASTYRLTIPTDDGALIAGEYIGPGGAVIKVGVIT